jgi:hypothetical protein
MTSAIAAVSVAALFSVGLISWRLVQPQGEIRCIVRVMDATGKSVDKAEVRVDVVGRILPVRPSDSQGVAVFHIASQCAGQTLRVTASKDDVGYADIAQSIESKDFSVSLVLKPKDVRK